MAKSKLAAQKVLVYVLDQFLRLLHPFMPFITEEIWQAIPHEGKFLMLADWPKYDESLNFGAEAAHMESVMNAIRSIRNRRARRPSPEVGVQPAQDDRRGAVEAFSLALRSPQGEAGRTLLLWAAASCRFQNTRVF